MPAWLPPPVWFEFRRHINIERKKNGVQNISRMCLEGPTEFYWFAEAWKLFRIESSTSKLVFIYIFFAGLFLLVFFASRNGRATSWQYLACPTSSLRVRVPSSINQSFKLNGQVTGFITAFASTSMSKHCSTVHTMANWTNINLNRLTWIDHIAWSFCSNLSCLDCEKSLYIQLKWPCFLNRWNGYGRRF